MNVYENLYVNLYVNLYASNNASFTLGKTDLQISQQTSYPWNGKVAILVNPKKESKFTIKLRVPGWARNEVLPGDLYSYKKASTQKATISLNGETLAIQPENGYFNINRKWKKGDKININLPMEVQEVETNSRVETNKNKVSLEYGPLVYAVEEMDNKTNFDKINISASDTFKVRKEANLLQGVNVIENSKFKAIPYYSWSNRGVGKMKVWIDFKN